MSCTVSEPDGLSGSCWTIWGISAIVATMLKSSVLHNFARRSTFAFLLALISLLPAFAAAGLVVCVCHDGHVSIEASCDPVYCCPDEACKMTTRSETALSTAQTAHPCVDIVLDGAVPYATSSRARASIHRTSPELPAINLSVFRHNHASSAEILVSSLRTRAPEDSPCTRFVVLTI